MFAVRYVILGKHRFPYTAEGNRSPEAKHFLSLYSGYKDRSG